MSNGKVLVVDDESSIRRICTLYLEAEGINVTSKADAEGVVELAEVENPDVIIMDLNMPGTNGFVATQMLKDKFETSSIPVLILSGLAEIDDKRNAMIQCGADDYLTKPFDPAELVTRISVLRRRKQEWDRQQESIRFLENQLEKMREKLTNSLVEVRKFDSVIFDMIENELSGPLQMIDDLARTIAATSNGNGHGHLALDRVIESTKGLKGLVSKLIELKKYRDENVSPVLSDISLGALVEPMIALFERRASEAGLIFRSFVPNGNYMIRTDSERVRRILALLFEKSVEDTRGGAVEFDVSVTAESLMLCFTGIHDMDNPKSAGRSASRINESAYPFQIKLPLARHIIEQLGGDLVVGDANGGDFRYCIKLPFTSH